MKNRLVIGVIGSFAALSLFAAVSASAATEFGNRCEGSSAASGDYTIASLTSPEPLPLTAPANGVVTKLKARTQAVFPIAIPTQVKVLRSTGGNSFTDVAEAAISIVPGETIADARLPVLAGDRLGLRGLPFIVEGESLMFTLYCSEISGAELGAVEGDVPLGTSAEFGGVTEGLAPISAVLEPDGDGDGYGDESQDLCPQSALAQVACPTVAVDAVAKARRKAAIVVVAATSTAPVSVTATVKLGKGKAAKLKATAKTVRAGKLGRFTLKFSGALNKALKKLPRSKKLTLKITATATDSIGRTSRDRTKVKLRGQA